jgi:hypothetical protein
VARVADMLAGPNGSWTHIVGDPANQYMDARSAGRVLALALDAWYLKVQSPSGVNWATQTQFLASEVMRSQAADGAFRYASTCWYSKPFMSGIAIEALVRYHQSFQPDARVADAVKRGVDYLWTKNWVPTAQAFTYIEGSCNGEVPGATADLNNLAVSGFGLAASTTGDATYLTRGDAVFSGGVYGAWIGAPSTSTSSTPAPTATWASASSSAPRRGRDARRGGPPYRRAAPSRVPRARRPGARRHAAASASSKSSTGSITGAAPALMLAASACTCGRSLVMKNRAVRTFCS